MELTVNQMSIKLLFQMLTIFSVLYIKEKTSSITWRNTRNSYSNNVCWFPQENVVVWEVHRQIITKRAKGQNKLSMRGAVQLMQQEVSGQDEQVNLAITEKGKLVFSNYF